MYEEHYGFSERPFQLTPDPAFYFESVTHKKALSYLGYGLNQGEGFVVITGEVGAGKSTLVAHLKQKLGDEEMTVAEVVTSALDGEEMVLVAARAFGLDVEGSDKASALAAIEGFLHDEARNGRRCLLIVDESQNLSIGALEELRMLSNFQLGAHPLMQTLLLGQPEFKQLVSQSDELEQLRQRIIAAHHLEPMQPGEVEPYIRHRLERVGWDGSNPELDKGLFAKLHKASGGIPRKVNQIMTRLLLLGAVEQQSVLEPDMLDAVLEEMDADEAPRDTSEDLAPRPDRNVPAAQAVAEARFAAMAFAQQPSEGGESGLAETQIRAIEEAFAERDEEIRQLREELASIKEENDSDGGNANDGLAERMSGIETRLEEQEQSLRHMLEMLIEFFESNGQRVAA